MQVKHSLLPIYDEHSKILILGTMPSPKSRETGFYYGHPQNRFWKVMAHLFNVSLETKEERQDFCHQYHIALYDVLESCEIEGASDASIKQEKPNDLTFLLQNSQIKTIFTTGAKAHQLYRKHLESKTHIAAIPLPSTSAANASMSLEKLIKAYACIKDYL